MMKQEFEKLCGIEVPGSVYDRIEVLYTATDENKQDFVKRVKKEGTVERIALHLLETTEQWLLVARAERDNAVGLAQGLEERLNERIKRAAEQKRTDDEAYKILSDKNEARGREIEAKDLKIMKLKAQLYDLTNK